YYYPKQYGGHPNGRRPVLLVVTGASMVDDNASATKVVRRQTVERSVAKMRIGSVNMHLAKKQKRKEFVYLIEHWVKADICGIVETWLKDNGEELIAELEESELQ